MALVLGTNFGFCAVAPTADPAEAVNGAADNAAIVQKDTSPATAAKIVEMGWWCDNATLDDVNFELGLYAADGGVVPGEAGTRLFVSATNAKGTTAGWKTAVVDWAIDPSTDYWLGLQLDDTTTATNIDTASTGGPGFDLLGTQTTLPNPFGGGAILDADGMVAIYAVWEAAAAASTTTDPMVHAHTVRTHQVVA